MKRYTPPPIPEETRALLGEAVNSGATQETIIAKMRELGIWQGRSIGLLADLTGIPHGDAKLAVHYSQAWADCREANEALQDSFCDALEHLRLEETSAEPNPASDDRAALQATR